jgi:hypothetical protein
MSTDPRTPSYQPMKVRSWGIAGRSSLWIGRDHLLQVSSGFVGESYRRWYWRDMQGLVARTSVKRLGWNIFWTVLAVLGLSATAGLSTLAIGGANNAVQVIFWTLTTITGVASLLCVTGIVTNSLLGPTCVVQVHTIHGPKEIPALTRRREFQLVTQTLRPMIEAAQQSNAAAPLEK